MAHYCPQCGTPTVKRFDGGRERDACSSCEWVQYAATGIGVGALIFRGAEVLLVERGIPPVGRWTIPSGWIEQDDTLETAVIREVMEETGLSCTPQGIICMRNIPKAANNELYICFLCEVAADAVPVPDGEESTQARFVHPDEFDAIDLSVFSRFVIEQYVARQPHPWPALHLNGQFANAAIFAPF